MKRFRAARAVCLPFSHLAKTYVGPRSRLIQPTVRFMSPAQDKVVMFYLVFWYIPSNKTQQM